MKSIVRYPFIVIKGIFFIIFWPFLLLVTRFISEGKFVTAHGKERVLLKNKAEKKAAASARAQLIEVISESSFQPILQFYLLLPKICLILRDELPNLLETDLKQIFALQSLLQVVSVITSFLSLGWSFNTYQVFGKRGALSFSNNPVGRILLLSSNILQISTRLTSFVVLAYCFGEGIFWAMFTLVIFHIFMMGVIHFNVHKKYSRKRNRSLFLYNCVVNGVANLYLHNIIVADRMEKGNHLLFRQMIVDAIMLLETVAILVAAFLTIPDIPMEILYFISIGYPIGIIMKLIYYSKFHIWKSANICSALGLQIRKVIHTKVGVKDEKFEINKANQTRESIQLTLQTTEQTREIADSDVVTSKHDMQECESFIKKGDQRDEPVKQEDHSSQNEESLQTPSDIVFQQAKKDIEDVKQYISLTSNEEVANTS